MRFTCMHAAFPRHCSSYSCCQSCRQAGLAALKDAVQLRWPPFCSSSRLACAPTSSPVAIHAADMYEHVATILPNVTRFAAGRRLLLQPGRGLLQALASQLRSGSELRRRGCAGAIKNCCFSCEADGTAGDIVAEGEVRAGRG